MQKRILLTLAGAVVLTAGMLTASAASTPTKLTSQPVVKNYELGTRAPATATESSAPTETPTVEANSATPTPSVHPYVSSVAAAPVAADEPEATPSATPAPATVVSADYGCRSGWADGLHQMRFDHYSDGTSVTVDLGPTSKNGGACITN
jgi:hypothetical protein